MKPVARSHTSDANVPAAENFLPDKRDHNGMINIMVCCVAGRDIFKSELGDEADHARIARLHRRVCSFVHRLKFADEAFYDYQCGVEHMNHLTARILGRRKLITRAGKSFSAPSQTSAFVVAR